MNYLELLKNVMKVTFTKVDGSERTMICTQNFDMIPEDKHPKSNNVESTEVEDLIKVFDLEANGWRSFKPSTVITAEAATFEDR